MRLTKKDYLEYYENSEIFHNLMDEMGLNKNEILNEKFEARFENLLTEINKTLASPNYFDHILILIKELCDNPNYTEQELTDGLAVKSEELALLHGSTKAISKILISEQKNLFQDSSNDGNTIFKRKAKMQKYSRAEQKLISSFLNIENIESSDTRNFSLKNYHVVRENTLLTRVLNYVSGFESSKSALFCISMSAEKFWSYARKECYLMLQILPYNDIKDMECRLYEPKAQKFTKDSFDVICKYLLKTYLYEKEYINWQFIKYEKADA